MRRHSKYLFVSSGHEGQGKMYTINTLGLSLFFIAVMTFSAIGLWSVFSGAFFDLPSKRRMENVMYMQKKIKSETQTLSSNAKELKKELYDIKEEFREKLPEREPSEGNQKMHREDLENLSLKEFVQLSWRVRAFCDTLLVEMEDKSSFWYTVPMAIPFSYETKWYLKNLYGTMKDPHGTTEKMHQGIDFAAVKTTVVKASAKGVVASTKNDKHFGNTVVLRHENGYSTVYSHLGNISVRSGERLNKGDALGTVGESGWTTSPLLHFEIRKGGRPVDPTLLLRTVHYN